MAIYTPGHFKIDDAAAIGRVLTEFSFATLLTTGAGDDPAISHVPVLFDPADGAQIVHGTIIGHVAAANPHAAKLAMGRSLLIFHGPSGYVSPNWYGHSAASVPTWNYVAVHAHGPVERIDSSGDKRAIVDALSGRHEAGFPHPWTSDKMDGAMLDKMLGAIVGFRMTVERFEPKFKLSQNRSSGDRSGVIDGLEARGSAPEHVLAGWMRDFGGG